MSSAAHMSPPPEKISGGRLPSAWSLGKKRSSSIKRRKFSVSESLGRVNGLQIQGCPGDVQTASKQSEEELWATEPSTVSQPFRRRANRGRPSSGRGIRVSGARRVSFPSTTRSQRLSYLHQASTLCSMLTTGMQGVALIAVKLHIST